MKQADEQLINLLLRDSDGNSQEFYSDLQKTPDGKLSFVVGRWATGEYYRHTIETVFLSESEVRPPEEVSEATPDEAFAFYSNCYHSGPAREVGTRRFCPDCRLRVDREFAEFWEPLIFPNGKLDVEEMKGNLVDYSRLIDNAKAVYLDVTAGNIGDLQTDADAVIGEAERQVQRRIDDALEESVEEVMDALDADLPDVRAL